jgi:pSer/pThr/pTyr-binding forkhead associated (FHA) protein
MTSDQNKVRAKPRDEALPERMLRRILEHAGEVFDRKLGRTVPSPLTTTKLIRRMNALINERVRDHDPEGRIAPHLMRVKIEWGTHSKAPPEIIKGLESEVLAAAIDHINDNRYNTLAPVRVETAVDIFTTGISVDPTFGEFEEQLAQEDQKSEDGDQSSEAVPSRPAEVALNARVITPNGQKEFPLTFKPGGKRLSVGRGKDNELYLNDATVSKIHAALVMNREGTLLVADIGSTNGTFVNGRRIAYGEARQIESGDVVAFGDVEVRFRRVNI